MKQQYVITDRNGSIMGLQMAGSAQRAVHLFSKHSGLVGWHLSAVTMTDWTPPETAGNDKGPRDPSPDETRLIHSDYL